MLDLLEAMGNARSIRHFRSDPIPDKLLEKVLWAATRASSPVNSQCWDFVVVRDVHQRELLGNCLHDFSERVDRMLAVKPDDPLAATVGAVKRMAENFANIPVLVIVVGTLVYPPHKPQQKYTYSAVYAAAQNLLVAATGLGLGAAFTTMHELDEPRFREILGIPSDRLIGVTVPLGWPAKGAGPVRRRPVEEFVHMDRW
jgi:nitroreductase